MNYSSTRGAAPNLSFDQVLLTGLASDGGLYVPDHWPSLPGNLAGKSYSAVAEAVLTPFIEGAIEPAAFSAMVKAAYATFSHQAVAPLRQIDEQLWLMELFRGPTLAFKDVALQLLGQLFDHVLRQQNRRVTIVGATSGDTGSAAIEAFRNSQFADIFILLPHGRVSEVQRRQMTTVDSANVHVVAIEGTFDDCQDLVKALFADEAFRDKQSLSAVNSINWARIMAQSIYYITATQALGRPVSFAVPTGNFGNVYAAHVARQMGLPIKNLIIGSNENDVLTRFFATGALTLETVVPTLSPAMDIQVSSNFERYLFELYHKDGKALAADIKTLRAERHLTLSADKLAAARRDFQAHRVDDATILATIGTVYTDTGMLIDPHTAVGVAAAKAAGLPADMPVVALACAHPAKFPEAVKKATGILPQLPVHLEHLFSRKEKMTVLSKDIHGLQKFISEHTVT